MSWDLRGAMLKKAEVESSRLADFEFRLRARAMAALAGEIGVEGARLVGLIVEMSDAAILDQLTVETDRTADDIGEAYIRVRAASEKKLIEEIGDPTPYRLA